MRGRALACAALIAAATPVAALDGSYGQNCTGPWTDDRPIVIADGEIAFYESTCGMTNPVNVRDMEGAVLFDLVCSGEGETWTERAFLQPGWDGGLILVWRGFAMTLPRCG